MHPSTPALRLDAAISPHQHSVSRHLSLSLSLPKRSSLRLVVEYNHTGRTINGNDELHVVDGRQLVQ